MPATPRAPLLPALAVALAALTACSLAHNATARVRHNDRAPHSQAVGDGAGRAQARGDQYELVATASPPAGHTKAGVPEDQVASGDLPAADKQYEYPLVRPVYAPFVTRPSLPSYAVPYVEILDHHRDQAYANKPTPSHFVTGSPMVSTVVVQDLSQTPPRPPNADVVSLVDSFHHLSPTKIPFTDVQVMTKPVGGSSGTKKRPNFTDKVQETSLEHSGAADSSEEQDDEEDDGDEDEVLLEDPPNLDVGGIVEDVVKKVFRENPVLEDAGDLVPRPDVDVKTWPCPPVTCCSRASRKAVRKCSTFVNCVTGRSPECPLRAERVPQALALSKPSNGLANATDAAADVRDGLPQPRFKKKKMMKKKKKFLKKFMMPMLMAYKMVFLMVVPLMVTGMLMMVSSSGLAGFFFALIGASITMVRVYTGATRHPVVAPPPSKVVKVIKYVQTPAPTAAAPLPSPSPSPAPTQPPTIIHHQPFVDEHFPTFHAPHHPPAYGSYYPSPYWTRHYDRSAAALDGGRKKRRRTDDLAGVNGVLLDAGDNQIWLV